ncbi:MAG: UDP-N-acetylmuramoyl-L-alanyl-D-glutamate--2,6-diaminopimelate ligase [Actinobacteria bacterium]|nr:UDP-N-acetylmuramoyl-L-alanyl-D-glutamate--2,6-diaminopimelate ligase [Actinomycetota bacterium]
MLRPISNQSKSLDEISKVISAQSNIDISEMNKICITGISQSSNEVEEGDIFIALAGEKAHGAQFAADAIQRGAKAVLTDTAGAVLITGVPVLITSNPRRSAGVLGAWFYSEPMRDLYSVGITGTNGKTTVTTILHQIMSLAGRESGLIGTIETRIGSEVLISKRTTPESTELQSLAAIMRERHMRNLIMEVSSHAITLDRIRGSHFAVVGFTNLSQDHLDFHKTMDKYFEAKSALFTFEYADLAIINIDDSYGRKLQEITELPVITLSRTNTEADWHYSDISSEYYGAHIAIRGSGGILIEGKVNLHGGYNYDNLLMAVAIAVESGIDPIDIASLLPKLRGASGRLESVVLGQKFAAFVDYAHSPDAVARVLETARELSMGRVIGVLGCGGDRDRTKRSAMGRALKEGSDVAIFTSDNPRSESAEDILKEMTTGIEAASVITDRAQAIRSAVNEAGDGDVVIILGKGHETGQDIAGVVHPFDDRIELAKAIEEKK